MMTFLLLRPRNLLMCSNFAFSWSLPLYALMVLEPTIFSLSDLATRSWPFALLAWNFAARLERRYVIAVTSSIEAISMAPMLRLIRQVLYTIVRITIGTGRYSENIMYTCAWMLMASVVRQVRVNVVVSPAAPRFWDLKVASRTSLLMSDATLAATLDDSPDARATESA